MNTNGTHEYFSDRENGPRALTHHEINESTWNGLVALVQGAIQRGDFGKSFPEGCPDTPSACCGTDSSAFNNTLRAEVPSWGGWDTVVDLVTACDFLEFCHRNIARASSYKYHEFCEHHHFRFDVEAGQDKFRDDVNFLLQRNAIALQLNQNGQMVRLLDDPAGAAVLRAVFQTGDSDLDQLLEEARKKFLSPDHRLRQEALERVWDAWERLKTLRDVDKMRGIKAVLDVTTTEPTLRTLLEAEAKALTAIGNDFRIRHSETNKAAVNDEEQVDYLFQRMWTMILLILRKNDLLAK